MTKFVVISGRKQVGKNTLATMIIDQLNQHNKTAKEISFADPLKKICHIAFGIPMEWMYGSDKDKERLTELKWGGFSEAIRLKYSVQKIKKQHTPPNALRNVQATGWSYQSVPRSGPMTVREVLQVVGSDIFRELIDKDVWAKAPFRTEHKEDVVFIPDGRFPNEIYQGKKHGTVMRVNRKTDLIDTHMSETALDNTPPEAYDRIVHNEGTLDDLKHTASDIAKDLLG